MAVCAVAVLVIGVLESSKGEWMIATDVQKYYRCLPFDWYFVTHLGGGFIPKRGELVRFKPPPHVERLTQAYEVIKIVAGVPGDRWQVEDGRLYINGALWAELFLSDSITAEEQVLPPTGVVAPGHVFVLGTNPSSYDSRYWGPLENKFITGKAHVLL